MEVTYFFEKYRLYGIYYQDVMVLLLFLEKLFLKKAKR